MNESQKQRYYALLDQVDINAMQDDVEGEKLKAVRQKKKVNFKVVVSSLVASFILFIALINLSPQIAYAMSQLSIFKPLVEWLTLDKGLADIVENEYYEPLSISQTIDGMTVTLTGVTADETGMLIMYEVSSEQDLHLFSGFIPDILQDEKQLEGSISSGGKTEAEEVDKIDQVVSVYISKGIDYTKNNFMLTLTSYTDPSLYFEFPFSLNKVVAQSLLYDINESLIIENQKIHVHYIKISPLRTELTMSLDKKNTKQILYLSDIQIVDEHGEIWGKIKNGVTQSGAIGDDTFKAIFESNYFRIPQSLTLKLNKVEAVDRDDNYLLIDFASRKVVYQPDELNIKIDTVEPYKIGYTFKPHDENEMFSFLGSIIDDEENVYYDRSVSQFPEMVDDELRRKIEHVYDVSLEKDKLNNPVKVEILRVNSYLYGDSQLNLK